LSDALARLPARSPQDKAGDVARFYIGGGRQRETDVLTTEPRERRSHHFNTGGLTSLML